MRHNRLRNYRHYAPCSNINALFARVYIFSLALLFCASSAASEPSGASTLIKDKDNWSKSLAVGFNLTSGNSDTTLFTILSAINRETKKDLVDFSLAYSLDTDQNANTSRSDHVTRNDIRSTASYNYRLSHRLYAGFGGAYLYDQIAEIDYRINLNPTVGYFIIKDDDLSLALEGGPGYTFEKISGAPNDYFSPRLADKLEWNISRSSKLYQKAELIR